MLILEQVLCALTYTSGYTTNEMFMRIADTTITNEKTDIGNLIRIMHLHTLFLVFSTRHQFITVGIAQNTPKLITINQNLQILQIMQLTHEYGVFGKISRKRLAQLLERIIIIKEYQRGTWISYNKFCNSQIKTNVESERYRILGSDAITEKNTHPTTWRKERIFYELYAFTLSSNNHLKSCMSP